MKSFLELIRNKFLKKEIVLKDPQPIVIVDLAEELIKLNQKQNDSNYKLKYEKCSNELNEIKQQLNKVKQKCETYVTIIKELNETAQKRNAKIVDLQEEKKQLISDCKEAANLLSLMEKGELTNIKKTYKIDHFPKDVQDFIYDIIKEYYNAN